MVHKYFLNNKIQKIKNEKPKLKGIYKYVLTLNVCHSEFQIIIVPLFNLIVFYVSSYFNLILF